MLCGAALSACGAEASASAPPVRTDAPVATPSDVLATRNTALRLASAARLSPQATYRATYVVSTAPGRATRVGWVQSRGRFRVSVPDGRSAVGDGHRVLYCGRGARCASAADDGELTFLVALLGGRWLHDAAREIARQATTGAADGRFLTSGPGVYWLRSTCASGSGGARPTLTVCAALPAGELTHLEAGGMSVTMVDYSGSVRARELLMPERSRV